MSHCTVRKDASYNKIGTPGELAKARTPATEGMKATTETPYITGTPAKAGSPATLRTSGTKGTPARVGILATAGA